MSEILTIDELAAWLRISRRSVYELTSERGRKASKHPLPTFRLGKSLRFVRADVQAWIEQTKEAA
jgi:excisionase family DNA binding protein